MSGAISVRKVSCALARHSTVWMLLAILVFSHARAQDRSVTTVAAFEGATRLAVDPLGNAYVVDRTRGRLIRINLSSHVETTLGGAESPVRDPVAVDAGNGLSVLVADGSTGRIARFNRDFVWAGDIGYRDESRARNAGTREVATDRVSQVYPTSVATLRTGVIVLLESRAGTLHILDRRGELDRSLRLSDLQTATNGPLDVCVDSRDGIHVLMSRPQTVLTLDAMGAVLNTRSVVGELSGTIACVSQDVLVPAAEGLLSLRQEALVPWPTDIDGSVVAVQRWGNVWLYLTEKSLYIRETTEVVGP
jgi:hypothetical protein